MHAARVPPDAHTYGALLHACAQIGHHVSAQRVLRLMAGAGIAPSVQARCSTEIGILCVVPKSPLAQETTEITPHTSSCSAPRVCAVFLVSAQDAHAACGGRGERHQHAAQAGVEAWCWRAGLHEPAGRLRQGRHATVARAGLQGAALQALPLLCDDSGHAVTDKPGHLAAACPVHHAVSSRARGFSVSWMRA
jgi:pentatricopeptide repeat protein